MQDLHKSWLNQVLIANKLVADIHVPMRKHPRDFGGPLTFPICCMKANIFTLSFVEISRHLLFGLRQNWLQTFITLRGWIPMTSVIPWLFLKSPLKSPIWWNIKINLLDDWKYNWLQTFMIPRGWLSEIIIFVRLFIPRHLQGNIIIININIVIEHQQNIFPLTFIVSWIKHWAGQIITC